MGCIEKFRQYTNTTAKNNVRVSCVGPKMRKWEEMNLTNCEIHARVSIDATAPIVPPKIKGRRRPQEHRLWSLSIPITGCTNMPHSGAAIQTRAVRDFESPNDIRYGYEIY
jgi:hypothetical protein